MATIDDFAALLFEEAKAFLEQAMMVSSEQGRNAYLHASLLVGFCSLEAHLNSMADDFLTRSDLSLLDKALLSERDIELKDGAYQLTSRLKMFRLEDRIEFLAKSYSTVPINKDESYWAQLKAAIKLRNDLTHPKTAAGIDVGSVKKALQAILDVLNVLYRGIYKRPHPAHKLGTDTTLSLNA